MLSPVGHASSSWRPMPLAAPPTLFSAEAFRGVDAVLPMGLAGEGVTIGGKPPGLYMYNAKKHAQEGGTGWGGTGHRDMTGQGRDGSKTGRVKDVTVVDACYDKGSTF